MGFIMRSAEARQARQRRLNRQDTITARRELQRVRQALANGDIDPDKGRFRLLELHGELAALHREAA